MKTPLDQIWSAICYLGGGDEVGEELGDVVRMVQAAYLRLGYEWVEKDGDPRSFYNAQIYSSVID